MKKAIFILTAIILSGIGFEGCLKKGEGDPFISFHSRKARITGDWKLSAGTTTDKTSSTGSSQTTTTTYNGTAANETEVTVVGTVSTTTTDSYGYTLSYTFDKDGTFTSTVVYDGTTTTYTGVWNFTSGVGDLKNKTQLVLTFLTISSGSSTITYTGVTNDMTYDIYQLKNKEMIMKQNTTSASSSTSEFSGEWTFTQ